MLTAAKTHARRIAKWAGLLATCSCVAAFSGAAGAQVITSEAVQSFAGTVSCVDVVNAARSKSWVTRVVFNRPVGRDMAAGAAPVAIQLGGLAGEWVGRGKRSDVAIWLPTSGGSVGSAPNQVQFTIVANGQRGSYAETGAWTIGVDTNGKATLQGRSRAATMVDPSSQAAMRVPTTSPREPSLPLAVPQNPEAKPWSATCTWNLSAYEAPAGPVSIEHIEARVGTPPATRPANTSAVSPVLKGSAGGCGEAWGYVTDGLIVIAAIAAVPTGGASIVAVLTVGRVATRVASNSAGSACLESELTAMNQQAALEALQIAQIDSYLGTATNAIYQNLSAVTNEIAGLRLTNFKDALYGISLKHYQLPDGSYAVSAPGLYGTFMNPNGVGLWNFQYQPAAGAPTDPIQLAVNDIAYNNASFQVTTNSSNFVKWLEDLSGTAVVIPTGSTCTPDPSVCVARLTDSALILLYESLFKSLGDEINNRVRALQDFSTAPNQNIVPLYDQYNEMLVSFWTQAVYAMQQAFQMEWMVNQMNYFRATSTTATKPPAQIGSWGGVPGTHYKYSNQSLEVETKAYNTAQKNLAKAYAARVNQLYLNTLNYIVSDVPVAPQAYPTAPVSYTFNGRTYTQKPVDYAQVGKNLVAEVTGPIPSQGPTPLSLIPLVAKPSGAPWVSATVLYQFSGLKDVAACLTNLQAYTESTTGGTVQGWLQTPGACPAIFTLADGSPLSYICDTANPPNCKGSVYDGNTLTPYTTMQKSTGAVGGPLALATTVTGNLKYCDPSKPALYLDKRGPMLNCGQWYVPSYLGASFPRANPPRGNTDLNYYAGTTYSYSPAAYVATAGCSNNLSFENAKYPLITTLTGDWSSGQPASCGAVIPTVAGQSPTLAGVRTITGNYDTGNQAAGCSLGWIGSGLGNPLPGTNDSRDTIAFALRLPRTTIGGNELGGWALPLLASAVCTGTTAQTSVYLLNVDSSNFPNQPFGASGPNPVSNFSADGYWCVRGSLDALTNDFNCTLTDGTQYRLTMSTGNGNGNILDVEVIAP